MRECHTKPERKAPIDPVVLAVNNEFIDERLPGHLIKTEIHKTETHVY